MPVLPITQKHGFKSQKTKCESFYVFALDISYVQFLDFGLVQEIYLFKQYDFVRHTIEACVFKLQFIFVHIRYVLLLISYDLWTNKTKVVRKGLCLLLTKS